MIIAVNTRFLLKNYLQEYGYFLHETLNRIVRNHPEHLFVFIFDRPYDEEFVFEKNVKPVIAGPVAKYSLLWKYWYDIKIPTLLRKYKADVFLSCDGICSLRTKLPQCLVMHDLAFLHYPSFIKKSHFSFYKKYTPKFLAKATVVATVSGFSKNDIIDQYKIDADKIDVVFSAAKEVFKPCGSEEKISIKNKYTDGKEYFLYTGAIHPQKNLMNLLKAFSVFKKRQKTNMKLVLAGRVSLKYKSFTESLKSYKYRDDVVMTGYVEDVELVALTGAAYGLIYPSLLEGFAVPVLEAMKCNVPVITSGNSAMQEIAKDAALYFNPESHTDIADKMMLLYKDENLRNQLIEKGRTTAEEYSWEKTAALLWQSIEKAINK